MNFVGSAQLTQKQEKACWWLSQQAFPAFYSTLHSSGQMVVTYEWAEIQGAKEIENLDRVNTLFGNHFFK